MILATSLKRNGVEPLAWIIRTFIDAQLYRIGSVDQSQLYSKLKPLSTKVAY